MAAIYYVKYLGEILDHLGFDNEALIKASAARDGAPRVKTTTVTTLRGRGAVAASKSSVVRQALENLCRLIDATLDLEKAVAGVVLPSGTRLTFQDVFQTANQRVNAKYVAAFPQIFNEGFLGEKPHELAPKQVEEIRAGFCFTPYITRKLQAAFDASGTPMPQDLIEPVEVAFVQNIVNETRRLEVEYIRSRQAPPLVSASDPGPPPTSALPAAPVKSDQGDKQG